MVTLQILVLSFQVRILVAQQGSLSVLRGFFVAYNDHLALTLSLNTLHHTTGITYGNRVCRNVARNH